MSAVEDTLRELEPTDVVSTSNGPVRGYREGGLSIFKGVRYAAAPVGKLRFAPPQRPPVWSEVVDTVSLGAPAIQVGIPPGEITGGRSAGDPPAPGQPGTDEDCLVLNVWTPKAARGGKRPVMVWLHGGGYANGSGGADMYDGEALARRGDVVMVTVNHRLNVFGYLHLGDLGGHPSSGEAGMLDIVLVLEWVRDNIARFGGDPGNVTIFGESGGGMKVSLLMAMPAAAGLFHRAIIQSGPGLRAASREAATRNAQALLDKLGIKAGELGKLETLSATQIQDAAAAITPTGPMGGFGPCVDGVALPRDPFTPDAPAISKDVPVLIGTNKDEATLFLFADPRFGEYTEEDLAKRSKQAAGDKAEALVAELRKAFPDYFRQPPDRGGADRNGHVGRLDHPGRAQGRAGRRAGLHVPAGVGDHGGARQAEEPARAGNPAGVRQRRQGPQLHGPWRAAGGGRADGRSLAGFRAHRQPGDACPPRLAGL